MAKPTSRPSPTAPPSRRAHLHEAVTLDELVRVARVYALTALNFCAPA